MLPCPFILVFSYITESPNLLAWYQTPACSRILRSDLLPHSSIPESLLIPSLGHCPWGVAFLLMTSGWQSAVPETRILNQGPCYLLSDLLSIRHILSRCWIHITVYSALLLVPVRPLLTLFMCYLDFFYYLPTLKSVSSSWFLEELEKALEALSHPWQVYVFVWEGLGLLCRIASSWSCPEPRRMSESFLTWFITGNLNLCPTKKKPFFFSIQRQCDEVRQKHWRRKEMS